MQQPRVISYKRFSSGRQASGDSLRRQIALAEEWCRARGWVLDDWKPTDAGRSGYSGAHRGGALGSLLDEIKAGRLAAGSYLLIESLDRLSREQLSEAIALLTQIVNSGIVVVTLSDEREYDKSSMNSIGDFIYSILLMSRAHEESASKGRRIRARLENARENVSSIPFGSAPGWLKRADKNCAWEVIAERAESVRRVFELAAAGLGSKAIAKIANEEKWPVPTRDTSSKLEYWHGALAQKLLRNRAVLGEHTFMLKSYEDKKQHWRGIFTDKVIENYYPKIIDDDLFYRASAAVNARKQNVAKRRDDGYYNIWSGVMKCGQCGGTIERKSVSKGNMRAELRCKNRIIGLTECRSGAASKTDKYLIYDICALSSSLLGLGYDKQELTNSIASLEAKLDENRTKAKNITELIAAIGIMSEHVELARKLRVEREELEQQLLEYKERLSEEPNSMLDTSYADKLIELLYEENNEAKTLRADFNARIRKSIEAIYFFAYDCAIVRYRESGVQQHVMLESKKPGDAHVWAEKLASMASGGTLELPLNTFTAER